MRRINLTTNTIDAAVEVFPGRVNALSPGVNNPTLLKDSTGVSLMAILSLWNESLNITSGIVCSGTPTVGIARLLVDPADSGTWGAESPGGLDLRIRFSNDYNSAFKNETWANGSWTTGYSFDRPAVLYDSNTGTSYIKASSHRLRNLPLDGVICKNSESEVFHMITSPLATESRADGPYMLVEGDNRIPNPPTGATAGQVQPVSKVFLGREVTGPKTIYCVWFNRLFFTYPAQPNPSGALWTWDLHLAKSTDKGVTWSNLSGSTFQTIVSRIQVENSAYTIEPGNYRAEYSEWGADVDIDGNIHLLLHRYRGNPSIYYTPGTTKLDWFGSFPADIDALPMDLIYVRFAPDGSRYENPTPLLSPPSGSGLPHRIQLVTGRRGEVLAVAEQPLRYNYSPDNGVTWDGWINIDSGDKRLFAQVFRDSDDPLLVNLLYHEFTTLHENKLYWRSIQFGAGPQQIEPISQTYEDVKVQGNSFGIHQVNLVSDNDTVSVPILADHIIPSNSVVELDDGTNDTGVTVSASGPNTVTLTGGAAGGTVCFMTRHRGRLNSTLET
jgi:hypothetical protein